MGTQDTIAGVLGFPGPDTARVRLTRVVRRLVWARHRQQLADAGWRGGFWAVTGMAAGVLGGRLGWWTEPGWAALAGVGVLALIGSLVLAWRDRASALQIAIVADVRLRLQQKLSTAWEVASRAQDPALAERLAAQAMRERIPVRVQRVFPLRLTVWGRLIPVAGAAMLAVAITDLDRGRAAPDAGPPDEDPVLMEEGARLLEYARDMQARTIHRGLPRAGAQAERLYRLSAGMQQGRVPRDAAVGALADLGAVLGEERSAALAEALGTRPGTGAVLAGTGGPGAMLGELAPAELLEALAPGALGPRTLERLARAEGELASLGVAPGRLAEALRAYRAGETAPLRELLERLAGMERLLGEADELGRAEVRVGRARRNLGAADPDATAGADAGDGVGGHDGAGPDTPGADPLTDDLLGDDAGPTMDGPAGAGARSGSVPRGQRELAPGTSAVRAPAPLDGVEVLALPARTLPTRGEVERPMLEVDRVFEHELEAVLAREDYPRHRKELVRRYFLGLSRDPTAPPAPSPQEDTQR